MTSPLLSATRPVAPELAATLEKLQPGQKIRITQTVRVGRRQWTTTVEGTLRQVAYLVTGLSTDRVAEDDIVVPTIHFTKENGELSSIAIDEKTRIELLA
jgi:hypothetical protein